MDTLNKQNTRDAKNPRAAEYFHEQQFVVFKRTDRIFAYLLPFQWIAAVIAAYFIAPLTWVGTQSQIHPHVWLAVSIGGLVTVFPWYFTIFYPGRKYTRYIVAVSQMLMSGVLVHVTGGRLETHFHIFGSLAFLAGYRDWKVLIPATLVTTIDHIFRGWLYPYSIYGVFADGQWRWLEHAGWVAFTDIFLIISCRRSVREMWKIAKRNAQLESSEERYRTVIEQMTEGLFLLEPKSFRVVECNEAFVRLLGCRDTEEAKSLTAFDFDTGDASEINMMTEIGEGEGRSLSAIRKYRKRDGTLIYVEITGRFISYSDTHVHCVNVRDITKRRESEIELKRLALVAQKTQNSVLITDPEGKIQWVNEGFTRQTGYALDEVVGYRPSELLHGEKTNKETVGEIYEALAKQKPFCGEIYNYGKDGTGYWLSCSFMPINNSKGEIKGFIAIEMDITERKAMEEKLREAHDDLEQRITERTAELVHANEVMQSEVIERKRAELELGEAKEFLHAVIDNLPNLIFVKDMTGNFVLVNKALANIFGTTTEDLVGKTDADFSHNPEEAAKFTEADIRILENFEEVFVPEEKHTDVYGNVHWYHTSKRSMSIGTNGAKYLVGIATDLTDRKILESQLRHSQKMESIGHLAAGIAHEINTPTQYVGDNARFVRDAFTDISAVLEKYNELFEAARDGRETGAIIEEVAKEIDLADLEYLSDEIPKAIQQSLEGVSRIAKIVQSMKDFAHPGTREKTAADLNKAIESTITVARNEWKYVADLETSFDRSLPPVPCLLGEINQVVLNLIINASHAIADVVGDAENARGTITVSTTRVNNEWAEIRIGDTGTGIPPEIQAKIFDPFFTTKEVGRGTGQGLAISHTVVVEKHHGKLDFETEPGKGTTFIIRLPLSEEADLAQ
jgi:PAS domain S-box-containing protein